MREVQQEKSSPDHWRSIELLFKMLGFASHQVRLAHVRSLGGIHASFQICFLEEVAPALLAIGGALFCLKLFYGGLGVLTSLDDLDHPGGLVGPDIVPNDDVG